MSNTIYTQLIIVILIVFSISVIATIFINRLIINPLKTLSKDLEECLYTLTTIKEKNTEEFVMRDPLTNLRNKVSYDKDISKYEDDISNGIIDYGIAVVNMDGLKGINDTYGHERGDEAIKLLSKIVCDVFTHSPVYRADGDEFIVILHGHDYSNAELLRGEFKGRIADTERNSRPWLAISARVGIAAYNHDIDDGITGVYERAKKLMGEDKGSWI